jgi:hypothetical protein
MISGWIGQPVEVTLDGRAYRLLVRQNGTRGRIAITIKPLDRKPPRSQDDQRGGQKPN